MTNNTLNTSKFFYIIHPKPIKQYIKSSPLPFQEFTNTKFTPHMKSSALNIPSRNGIIRVFFSLNIF